MSIGRRQFIRNSLGAGAGMLVSASGFAKVAQDRKVRIGIVGVGSRGTGMMKRAMESGAEVAAVCDIVEDKAARAQRIVQQFGQGKPKAYTRGPEDYKRLVEQNDLDAVFTATPWELHTPVMLAAMNAGKYASTEMPACLGIDEGWQLVETSEKTGMPCMLMENYCYMRHLQMIMNMVRQGAFGSLSHCEVGYQHDTRYVCIDANGELLWRGEDKLRHDGNRYPTHSVGPAAQWLDVNRGDSFEYLVSMSSRSQGLNYYVEKVAGKDHPNAKLNFQQGDVNTTLIKTRNGATITLYYDVQTPRPVDHLYRIQGTKGIYTEDKLYLEHFERKKWYDADSYQDEYDHPNWKKHGAVAINSGHGGSDYMCMLDFITAVRNKSEVPIDVYDAATWSVITEMTETSVRNKSQAVDFPDFTKGKWKTRKPAPIKAI